MRVRVRVRVRVKVIGLGPFSPAPLTQGLPQVLVVVSLDPRQNLKAPKFLDGHAPACDVAQILQDLIVGFVASWFVAVFASGVGAWEVLGRPLTTLRVRSSECRFPIFPLQTIAYRRGSGAGSGPL